MSPEKRFTKREERKVLIRVVAAYKTVSTLGHQVITGIPPIDLLAEERKYMYDQDKNGKTR